MIVRPRQDTEDHLPLLLTSWLQLQAAPGIGPATALPGLQPAGESEAGVGVGEAELDERLQEPSLAQHQV